MRDKLSVVGKSVTRIDAIDKVTGKAKYGIDLKMDDMLYAKILRSPYPHARVVAIDTRKAESHPGVRAIVTINEAPKVFGSIDRLMTEEEQKSLYILDNVVRFIGDPVAAVAAETEESAEEALSLIDVEYEQLPPVFDPIEAMKDDAPQIHEGGNIAFRLNVPFPLSDEIRSLDDGFSKADYVFENRFVTSKTKHCAIEPFSSCVADYNLNGRLTVYSSSQRPHFIKTCLAGALGLPVSKVRIIKPYTGGAFGGRDCLIHGLEVMCCFLSKKTGKPVKMSFTREEDFEATESQHPFLFDLKTGVTKDGILTAMTIKAVTDAGGYDSQANGVLGCAMGVGVVLYRCPYATFEGYAVYTNKSPSGSFRGYGHQQMNFALESQMDMIAEKLGIDPVELRLKNHRGLGEVDPIIHDTIRSDGLEECLRKGAEKFGWNGKRTKTIAGGTKKRGVGMSCVMLRTSPSFFLPETASAIIMLNSDGSVSLLTGAADDGQGNRTALAQIAAEELSELGIGFEQVSVSDTDTDVTPFDTGTIASRQPYSGGFAVKKAAEEVKNTLLRLASQYLNVERRRLRIKGGVVHDVKNPATNVSVRDLLRWFQFQNLSDLKQIIGVGTGVASSCPLCFGANFAEVEVDTDTGEVRVVKLVFALDVGRAINPAHVEGQITGGQVMGIGYALTEGLVIKEGKILNNNLADYRILRACDVPEINAIIVESNEPTGPFGAKGAGQATNIGAASAIANAIYDAVGVRVKELPITQEKILEGLH